MPRRDDLADEELSAVIECVVAADFGEGGTASSFALDEHVAENPRRAAMHAGVIGLWDELGALESPPLSHETAAGRNEHAIERRGSWSRARHLRAAAFMFPAIAAAGLSSLALGAVVAGDPATQINSLSAGRRVVGLEDGSTVDLMAGSALSVRLKSQRRDVVLKRGEATFKVASDPDRPFVVAAGDGRIQAIGTAFNVRLQDRQVVVTAVDGSVIVEARPSADKGKRLQFVGAGQQVTFGQERVPAVGDRKRAITPPYLEDAVTS